MSKTENSLKALRSELKSFKAASILTFKELERKIEKFENQPPETTRLEKLGFYEPEDETDYFALNTAGEVLGRNGRNLTLLKENIELGNSFKTHEDADAAANRNEIRADLLRNSKEFVFDEPNFYIEYDLSDHEIAIDSTAYYNDPCKPYFTKEKAREMIDKWGDDLKLLNL